MKKPVFWLSVSAGAAIGAASYFLGKKLSSVPKKPSVSSAPVASAGAKVPNTVPASVKEASYSFISGFKDAETVTFRFPYDAARFRFAVAEDEFLAESGDSHVGLLYGEAFSAQFEYGTYYGGEDYARLCEELASRHPDLADVSYTNLTGVMFRDGDNLCLAFPIPEDAHSYLLVTLIRAADNDDELETLPDSPDFRALMNGAKFDRV